MSVSAEAPLTVLKTLVSPQLSPIEGATDATGTHNQGAQFNETVQEQ